MTVDVDAPAAPPAPAVATAPPGLDSILVRLPNWLGDVVMAAPAVAAIAKARPQARITAQVKAPFMPLATCIDGVDEVIPTGRDRSLLGLWRSRGALKARSFDAAVVFPRSTRAGLAPWLARIPVRVGYGGKRLFTHRATDWRPLRAAHRTAWFGLLAGAFETEPALPWTLTPTKAMRDAARQLLLANGRRTDRSLVVLEPGASYGAAKCWPAEHFGRLAASLVAAGHDVATVGLPATQAIEARIAAESGASLIHLAGKTPDLGALIGVLAAADVVVSNDTGPMHVAAALGTPTVAMFGASDPVVSSPGGPGPKHVVYDPEPCSPCFLRTCSVPGHPCLTKIAPARVLALVERLLA